ncbi:MAG: galactokinase [Saprospiraceae bacterium]|nr:galactokinase [Saprospiraceae bacterium]
MANRIKAFAPGRINLIGEHTDYNQGYVLPTAIDQGITFNIQKNGSGICHATALQFGESQSFGLENELPRSGWINYVMGTALELQKKTGALQAFTCEFAGNVPIGSGMSSSAALGCSMALGLNELFELGLSRPELAQVVQLADHNYVGVRSGIMDQFTSLMGKEGMVMLLDCRDLSTSYFPFELGEYSLLLLNTKVSHTLANSAYNDRREACERVAQHLGHSSLRDVTLESLLKNQTELSSEDFTKARFVIEENGRVLKTVDALKENDLLSVGAFLNQSHEGLSKSYQVSCDELDFLVGLTTGKSEILGARMMGGGFGGCTLNLIRKDFVKSFINEATSAYKDRFDIDLEAYEVEPKAGARILEKE